MVDKAPFEKLKENSFFYRSFHANYKYMNK